MNPAIAALSEKFRDLPRDDWEPAHFATFTDGIYRWEALTMDRVEEWLNIRWDQESGNVALPPVCELD